MRELKLTKQEQEMVLDELFELMIIESDEGYKMEPFVNLRKHVSEMKNIDLSKDSFNHVKKAAVKKVKSAIVELLQSYLNPKNDWQLGNSFVFVSGGINNYTRDSKFYPKIKLEISLTGHVTITSIELDVEYETVFTAFQSKLPYTLT